ncbi:MAG: glycosyltransferase [Candidatus Promineofilum sp.]|nr:glycosyltransferase [Promineifilum sp.]
MSRSSGRKVAILSSVHLALDNRVFYREARTLARAGYDVTLIAVHDRDETRDGVRIRALPRVARSRRPLLWRALGRMARETGADLFHFHDPELLLLSPWLRRATGRPTIYDIHEANADFIALKEYLPRPVRHPLAGLFRRLEPRLAAGESGLIFADDAIAADFAGFSGPKTTLFNFPGQELITRGAAATGPRPDPVVLYLGGLERNRGAALLSDAFARVVAEMPAARLLLVGHFAPPELEAEVRADAERRGIAHAVEITGRVPFAAIGDYLARARVGWVTWGDAAKNRKNIPTKLFEYMAYGLPVVSSDLPSTRPFVPPEVGLLAAAGDPAAHAAALLRLLGDPATAERMGAAGQRRVTAEWNWKAMEPRLLALYESVLGKSSTPRR